MKGFVAKKVTLSEEALEIAENFRKAGSFRSLSQTLEEVLRRVHYIKESGTFEAAKIQLERLGVSFNEGKTT